MAEIKNSGLNSWQEYSFDDLFTFDGSMGIPRERLGDTGIPYLHYGDMHTSSALEIDLDKQENELPRYDVKSSGKSQLNNGDLVFVDASEDYEGTCKTFLVKNVTNKPFISGMHTFIAHEKQKVVCDDFKKYLTKIPSVRNQIFRVVQGYKVYGINRDNLKKVVVNLPKYEESKKIVQILDTWQKAVVLQTQLIEKLKEQKKALMQILLTPKAGWTELKLGDVIDFYNGYPFESKDYIDNGKYKIITISNVKDNQFCIDKNTASIAEIPKNIRPFQILKRGDILISMTGNVGRVCLVDQDNCLLNQRVGKIEVKNAYAKVFIYYLLSTHRFIERMKMHAVGAAQDNMSVKDVLEYKLSVPNFREQLKSAEIIQKVDYQILFCKNNKKLVKRQQAYLIQNLLTGKLRVKL